MIQTIVFDIGNTNITIGVFQDSNIFFRARLDSDTSRTTEEYEILLQQILQRESVSIDRKVRVVIGSVVPILTQTLEELVRKIYEVEPVLVSSINCGQISLNIPYPESVGADRIGNALAAAQLYSKPSVVVDFGTATTFDIINSSGDYEGGIIAPGPETSLAALVQRTAKLQKIDLVWPEQVMGKTTEEAMQSGLVIGYMALIDGLIERLQSERGELGKIIATGGLGNLFVKHSKHMKIYDPDLTLIGFKIIGDRYYGF